MSPDRTRLAGNLQGLNRWIHEWVVADGEDHKIVRRRIGIIVLGGVVDRVRDSDGEPVFVFKGGSSLGIRYGSDSRSSKDVDFAYVGAIGDVARSLDLAAEQPYQEFTARFLEPEPLEIPWHNVSGIRLQAKLSYRGRPFVTLPLDIVAEDSVPYELVPSLSLSQIGVERDPETLPCLSLSVQIAQKLHACTDPMYDGRNNDRVHDVMDLLIIASFADDEFDWQQVHAECKRTFAERDKQPWPPVLMAQEGWEAEWSRLVEDNTFPVTNLNDALDTANELIHTIEQS